MILTQNPCIRPSLLARWPRPLSERCALKPFPDAIIAGPQKTGLFTQTRRRQSILNSFLPFRKNEYKCNLFYCIIV